MTFTALLRAEPVAPLPAPSWKLKDVNGVEVSSAQLKGKVVVVDFWATWCGPCRMEIPGYVELQKKYGKDRLVIVGMSVDAQGPGVVKTFIEKNHMNYQVVMADENVQAAFGGTEGIQAIPTTFIIDREGQIRDRKVGAEHTETFEQRLAQYLK
jgi:thiol-disulfide isomerase/thioredoxin